MIPKGLCLSHEGRTARREKLHPLTCRRCLDTVLRGRATDDELERVMRSSELWIDEEERLG